MLYALYLLGTAAFAVSGVPDAHRAGMDPFGGLVLAFAAAYLVLHRAGVPDTADIAVSAGLVLALRMAAVVCDLYLPRLRDVPD
ncbi:TRIC cation channel family protein [Streptomyces erythrochromogenes]|uniref:TRIC cation channel family protein n=1 Tax=Streptomyces erythrochromogenes TaxID=285574 RepID=UPI0038296813